MEENNNNNGNFEEKLAEAGEKIENAEQKLEEKVLDNVNKTVSDIQRQTDSNEPGKGAAIASLVLGISAVVCWFFGYSALVSVICGIVGIVCAANSKKQGFTGSLRTAGFVLSLIGLIGGAIVFVACVACVGCLAAGAGAAGTL